jgi:hypothetical protein
MVVSSFLVEVEQVDTEELYTQYPEAFAAGYDTVPGSLFSARVNRGTR